MSSKVLCELDAYKPPTKKEFRKCAKALGFVIPDDKLEAFMQAAAPTFRAIGSLDRIPDFLPRVKYPRTPGYEPVGDDNKYNAWYRKVKIEGSQTGIKLKGRTVALKDNICLAGVPMMVGSTMLEGYVPDVDATVVRRILDAGGVISGKVRCENLCLSGGSHTGARGHVQNPRARGYSAGGSSSGSAAAVAAKEVDMSLGGDQGGSIRTPASFTGTYGLKPTFGLVPYTGIAGLLNSIDHTGPITNSTIDNALLLEAIAGPDGLDARQGPANAFPGTPALEDGENFGSPAPALGVDYTTGINRGIKGMRIALVKEGFELSEPIVATIVKNASNVLLDLGAVVEEVSIPFHLQSRALWCAVTLCGACLEEGFKTGHGEGYKGMYVTSLVDAFSSARALHANRNSDSAKTRLITAEYNRKKYGSHWHAKGANLVRQLTLQYDRVLAQYDLIMMPTCPKVPPKLPDENSSLSFYINSSFSAGANTAAFNLTGHPALSVPCGKTSDNLPIGMMLVGRKLDERTIYRVSYAFEHGTDWNNNVVSLSRL